MKNEDNPINMKISGAHFQIMNNEYTIKKKIHVSISWYMRGQNHVHGRGTDGQAETNIPPPPPNFRCGGILMCNVK